MRDLILRGLVSVAALSVAPLAAAADLSCDDCTFYDIVAHELRATSEGPAESSLEFLECIEGDFRLREDLQDELGLAYPPPEELEDEGDPEYDEDSDPWWVTLLRLLLAAAEYTEELEMNGTYDGTLTIDGTEVRAFMELDHFGTDVRGRIAVLDPVVIDGGICGGQELPAGAMFQINGQEMSQLPRPDALWAADGSTRRRVRDGLFFDVYAETSFSFSLLDDYETLTGSIDLRLTDPCADTTGIQGRFVRRAIF